MDFGLFMMPLHPLRRSFADAYDRDIALIVQADRLGYHEAWRRPSRLVPKPASCWGSPLRSTSGATAKRGASWAISSATPPCLMRR